MTTTNETNGKILHISEGILIAIISGFAYLFVYLNEFGYVKYFNLPKNFIHISLEQILLNSLIMIFLGFSVILAYFSIYVAYNVFLKKVFRRPQSYPKDFINAVLRGILLIGFFGLLFEEYIQIVEFINPLIIRIIELVIVSIIVIIYFWRYVLIHLNNNNGENNDKQSSKLAISIFTYKIQLYSKDIFVFFLLLVCSLSFSYLSGYRTAKTGEKFYVVNTNPEMVVLRSYDETLICAPFDRDTNIVQRKFTIVEIKEELGIFASYEHLGRLRPAEIIVPVEMAEPTQDEQESPE